MENCRNRLMVPDDFSSSVLETNYGSLISQSNLRTLNKESSKINNKIDEISDLGYRNVKDQLCNSYILNAEETKAESENLLSCLNSKAFSIYQCFGNECKNSLDTFKNKSDNKIGIDEFCENAPKILSDSSGILKNDILPYFNGDFNTDTSDVHQKSYIESTKKETPDLLTPDSFLLPKSTFEPIKDLPLSIVPETFHEAHHSSINTNLCTNSVQNNACDTLPLKKDENPVSINNKDKEYLSISNVKSHSDDEKFLNNSLIKPIAFSSLSVRRKLNFENYNGRIVDSKLEKEKKYPEFNCSLNIPDNFLESLSIQSKESKVFSSDSPFQKNPYPPIGVFWDIENCGVPKGLSATHVVQAIRNRFFDGYKEAEFVCVCDTLKENAKVLEELNDAQVNIIHVGSLVKNAADDKLLQSMRRFADIHGAGASIILISGDSDFATELYDLRYRKKLHVILVHNAHAQDSLKLSAHETALFSEVTQELPLRSCKSKNSFLSKDVIVWNLPIFRDHSLVRRRLHYLSSNCGGKYITVQKHSAKISFTTPELAARAKKRIEGENVCGNKVNCTFARPIEREFSRTRQQELFGSAWRPVESKNFEQRDEDYSYQNSYRRSSNEELPMENPSKGFWNKSSGYSSTMTDNSYNNAWRMQSPPIMANGHAFTNSPTFNSSQGSSREASPSYFLRKSEPQSTYRASPSGFPVNNGIPHSVHDRSQHLRYSKPSAHIWPDNNANGSQCSRFQTVDHTFGLGNLSLADTQESMSSMSHAPVELLITNLDQNIDAREMKKILLAWFRERVMVLHVSVFVQSDGYLAATITVPSQLDAQYAISQLHRKRIGTKRIVISHITHVQQPPEIKRSKVLTLLKEVPGRKLPLFKFRELYERRYQETIGVSEMYNMRDLISVSDNSTGRMVCLNSEYWSLHSFMSESNLQNPDELRYCKFHSKGPDKSVGWAERDHSAILPNVCLTLKEVGNAMQILLNSHSGNIPLASLVDCYREEVGPLPEDPNGVPLEHLISCLSGLLIVVSTAGFKYVRRSDSRNSYDPDDLSRYVSPPLVGHLALFSRELVDLLKTFPHCQMLLSRFIPAYHHHFGRQCRVADYGYTKLSDLLVSLPHLIQIMGEGTKKTLTLSHRVQVKRFSSDLLRVLKGQPFKMITLQDFPEAFEKSMGRPWNVTDYGVCEIMDLLREIQETTVVLKNTPEGTTIAIPKREQTAEEIERTRLFATEVVELLRHSPQCKMQFNRFVPAYHHHFGRQCRVSDFGFSKLIELLEAIPDVLQVLGEDEEGERNLQLVEKERIRILGDQIFTLVKNSPKQMIGISALAAVFMHYYGYSLKPSHYKCDEFEELIGKLRHYVKIEEQDGEPKVTLVDRSSIDELWTKTRKLLWDEPKCSLPYDKFVEKYMQLYESTPDLEVLKRDLQDYLMVLDDSEGNGEIELDPVQIFARDLLILLNEAGGRMLLINLESSYLNRFGVACRPASLGYPNLTALLQSFGDLVIIKGKRTKRIIVLNREKVPDLPNYSPPVPVQNHTEIEADSKWEEYSCIPVPPPPSQNMGGSVPNFVQGVPPTSCDQKLYNKDLQGSHMIMGVTPPPPQQTYQPASPVIYSGSPAGPNGSVVWGQVWSPQYSVIPPVSPAHYMMPTIPINWGNIPSASLAPTSNIKERENHKGRAPVSIKTLEQLGKETPPNPCELPSPEYLTNNGDLVAEGLFPDIEECALASGGISESRDQSSQNFSKKSGCAF